MPTRPNIRANPRPTMRGGYEKRPWLPEQAQAFLARKLAHAAGLVLLGLAFCVWLSLLTYHSGDPSLNTASTAETLAAGETQNWLGRVGSYSSDWLQQGFGLGAYLLVVILAAWGWRMFSLRGLSPFLLRVAAGFATLSFAAISLQCLVSRGIGHASLAPVLAPVGGVMGQLVLALTQKVHAVQALAWVLAVFSLTFTVATLYLCCGLSWEEWQQVLQLAHRCLRQAGRFIVWACKAAYALVNKRVVEAPPRFDLQSDTLAEDLPREKLKDVSLVCRTAPPAPPVATPVTIRNAKKPMPRRVEVEKPAGEEGLPPLALLQAVPATTPDGVEMSAESLNSNARMLEQVLADFGVQGRIIQVSPGPVVTLYDLEPAPGIKSSRVIGLADDIARSMSALSVRVAVVPGRNVIGIELPNQKRETVYLREMFANENYQNSAAKLPLALGKDIGGAPVVADLARMPHLLVAGTTGSGKSVAINTMILSLLYRYTPRECRFIMVDPKMLELSVYEGIAHLLAPVVTEPKKAVVALKWAVKEMESRYRNMSKLGVRNIDGYNMRIKEARDRGETLMRKVQTGFDPDTGKPIFEDQPLDLRDLPYIVVIVDEMADLMLVAGKEVEASIQRLAQMARAAGIHLIMATQRPSVDVITGTIKANFPSRVSFQVTSKIDSRTILGEMGAEQLLGQGDMLYMAGGGRVTRVHGPFVSDKEVEGVVNFIKTQSGEPDYVDEVTREDEEGEGDASESGGGNSAADDLYDKAVDVVLRERKASTSFIQRHLQIGYNRAARLMDLMEKDGIVGAPNHVGKREILGRTMEE